jgi:hypothetical protein
MEGIIGEAVSAVLEKFGVLGFFVALSFYLLWVVFRDRKKHNGNGSGMAYARKSELDEHKKMTADHLIIIEGRIADNYEEFLKFQTDVAKELATKDDLDATERRIITHIDVALRR